MRVCGVLPSAASAPFGRFSIARLATRSSREEGDRMNNRFLSTSSAIERVLLLVLRVIASGSSVAAF